MQIKIWIVFSIVFVLFLSLSSAEEISFRGISFPKYSVSIDLEKTTVKNWNEFYDFLSSFPNLKSVSMFATRVYMQRAEEMSEKFPNIEFGWTLCFAEHTVRSDATAFSTLHWSGATTHSSKDISIVKYCKKLQALDIGHNGAKDLSFLYELPDLRVLIIACNKIEDITPIASLKNLEYLEMFSNQITDITPLTQLEHLTDLNIGYNRISDLTPLYEMKQLQKLWMYNCIDRNRQVKISDEQLALLQEHLPNTVIDTKHNPSEGGWRTGLHYETIHQIFSSGKYIPFEDSWNP